LPGTSPAIVSRVAGVATPAGLETNVRRAGSRTVRRMTRVRMSSTGRALMAFAVVRAGVAPSAANESAPSAATVRPPATLRRTAASLLRIPRMNELLSWDAWHGAEGPAKRRPSRGQGAVKPWPSFGKIVRSRFRRDVHSAL